VIHKISALLVATALLAPVTVQAASPSAKPVTKSTTKTTAKPVAKPASQSTSKPVAKPASKSTSKPVAKPTAKVASTAKKPVRHTFVRKRVSVTPSPSPVWPPKGYAANNGVYALIPSSSQLVSLLSSKSALASTISQCKASACGAVYVGSDTACQYWEINSKVYGPDPADATAMIQYGTLRTLAPATNAKIILPIILVSSEPLIPHESIILSTLGISQNAFYTQIAQGKSLTQIAGSKINTLVSAITADETKTTNSQLASGAITSDQAQGYRDNASIRVATELTNYNLSVGGITISCWSQAPTDKVPSFTYTANPNHF
jgi:hypothetical protein